MMVLSALLIMGVQAFAQNAVSGKVTDASGEPLVGVNVLVKGTTTGAMTDLDGNFALSVPKNAILVFSSIGYTTQEVAYSGKSSINVALADDTMMLDDVVVVGYGTAKRKDLTGSLTQIDNKLIAAQNTSSVTKVLEGAVPGLVYSAVDAQPGNDAGLRVRGLGSTSPGNSNALIIIDGVPAQGDDPLSQLNQEDIASITVLKDAASSAIYGSRGANGVILVTTKSGKSGKTKVSFQSRVGWNTAGNYRNGQIDSAQELYEYVWQSIYNSYRYGAGDSHGPVMNAATGEYTSNVGSTTISHDEAALFASQHLFDYIGSNTSFGRNILGNYMAYHVPGAIYTPTGTSNPATASATMSGAYLVGLDGKLNPDATLLYNDSYADEIIKTGFRQQYDLSASGGNDKEDHYISFGYMSDPSYIRNSDFDRFTGRVKLNAQLFKWLKVGTNVAFSRSRTSYQAGYWNKRNSGTNQGNVSRFINGHNPIIPFYAHDASGDFIYDANGDRVRNYLANSTYSPLGQTGANYGGGTDIAYVLDNDVRQDVRSTLNTRTYAEIPFLNHFTFRTDFAYDKINNLGTYYYNATTGRASGVGYFAKKSADIQVINIQNRLTYTQDFGKHHVDALALFENSDWESENVNWGSSYEFLPGFLASSNFIGRYVGAGQASTPSYGHDIERMRSYLGRANYIYDDKYYASASIRWDGSSKFRASNRWGTFWSVGAGWRFSSEKFMKDFTWLNNGKLRASYGVLGNQNGIGRYQTYRTWTYSASKYAQTEGGTGTPVGYKLSMGATPNTELTWEETKTLDIGLDLTVFNRVDFTFDFFNRITGNAQFNQPVSYLATGQSTLARNIAELTNRGIEIDINADIIRTKDWRWNLSVNATHYTTKLTGLPDDAIPDHVEGLPDGTWESYDGANWSAAGGYSAQAQTFYLRGVGRDWYNIYMYSYAGLNEQGLPMYWQTLTQKDIDNDTKGLYTGHQAGDNIKTTDFSRATKQEIGDALPWLSGGFNTSVSFKNWTLSAQFAYQLGGHFFLRDYAQYLYNPTINSTMWWRTMMVSKDVFGNTWSPDNTGASFPMQWYPVGDNTRFSGTSVNGQSWKFTDQALFSASYLRLKTVTLSYNAPASLFKRLGMGFINGMRLFASADNLFLLSAAKSVDPSMSIAGGYVDVDEYIFPMMRAYTLGVNIDF